MNSTQGASTSRSRVRGDAGRRRRKWIWAVTAIGIFAAIGLAAGVTWAVTRDSDQTTPPVVSGQPVPELTGRQAPAFTLLSATGAPTSYTPYTYTPGDGKKHLFVFFMGVF